MTDIRDERPDDIAAIRAVNRLAFQQDQEANIVDALRANGAILLSLVAAANDQIVGHIMFSPATVGDVTGAALGPMAVLPDHQRQGIGGKLIQTGIERLRVMGCPFILVLGHAQYYPRFGFSPARAHGIRCEWDAPDEAFMVLHLDEARSPRVSGRVVYRPEFSTVT